MTEWWRYENLPSREPCDWSPAGRGERAWDSLDFHIDLGCGRIPKARLGIDLRPSPGATALAIDFDHLCESPMKRRYTPEQLAIIRHTADTYDEWRRNYYLKYQDTPMWGLPFPDESIKSIVSHHALEHVGDGFEHLMEECYRILEWGGVMRAIVPIFPSTSAISEYDHQRYFMEQTWIGFTGSPNGDVYTDGFSEPYNTCRFKIVDMDITPPTAPEFRWTEADIREMRVTLWKHHGTESEDPEPEDYLT